MPPDLAPITGRTTTDAGALARELRSTRCRGWAGDVLASVAIAVPAERIAPA